MAPNEDSLRLAIAAIQQRRVQSLRQAAALYNVDRKTLGRRLNNTHKSYREAAIEKQLLSEEQETLLTQWILHEEARGLPPTRQGLHNMVLFLVRFTGLAETVGKHWVDRFLERHPEVHSKIGMKLDIARFKGTQLDLIVAWFERLKSIVNCLKINPSDISNMDETGLALGCNKASKVIGTSQTKQSYRKSPETREWVSIIECVTATGTLLQPLVIFRGQSLQTTWFTQELPNWKFIASNKGWTNNAISLNWLRDIYLPATSPPRGEFRLLIVDGHGSHETSEFAYEAFQHKVVVFYLPPHSSHELQPLDLACFSPLKRRYRSELQELAQLDDAAPVKKTQFISLYKRARSETMTPQNIEAGFRHAGIVPLAPQVVLRRLQGINQASKEVDNTQLVQNTRQKQPQNKDITTPQNTRDLSAIAARFATQTPSRRSLRTLIQKTSKTIDRLQHNQAVLVAQNKRYLDQIERLRPHRRVRVAPDANSMFSSIGNIQDALSIAAARQERYEADAALREAKQASDETIRIGYEAMCSEFQLRRVYSVQDVGNDDGVGGSEVGQPQGGSSNGV